MKFVKYEFWNIIIYLFTHGLCFLPPATWTFFMNQVGFFLSSEIPSTQNRQTVHGFLESSWERHSNQNVCTTIFLCFVLFKARKGGSLIVIKIFIEFTHVLLKYYKLRKNFHNIQFKTTVDLRLNSSSLTHVKSL